MIGSTPPAGQRGLLSLTLVVAALGYFVDIYDIVLFTVVRRPSCTDLGIAPAAALSLLDWQMAGMLLGGFFWGILGDRCGRRPVLFGSILVYSLANLANAGVGLAPGDPFPQYAALRFIAGFGLAGELGAAITLVAETSSARMRGYATTLVASVGIAGAAAAVGVSKLADWRQAYLVGGLLGLALLVLRLRVLESGMFAQSVGQGVVRGSLLLLLGHPGRILRLLLCTAIGLPIWFMVGLVAFRGDKVGAALGTSLVIDPAWCVLACYLGLIVGDLGAGLASQWLRSRRIAVALAQVATALALGFLLTRQAPSPTLVYACCGLLGITCGYWAVFVTIAAEQFGTNLRSTVAGIVPNLVRGAVPLWSWLLACLGGAGGSVAPSLWLGLGLLGLALVAVVFLRETYAVELDYQER